MHPRSHLQVLYGVNQRLRVEDVDSPLVAQRPVKSVALVVVTGDRGLCGGYNNFVIKKTEARAKELEGMGINVRLICVGRKGGVYFRRRPQYNIESTFEVGQQPTIKEAQAIADDIFADFVSQVCWHARLECASSGMPSPAAWASCAACLVTACVVLWQRGPL